MPSEVAGMVLRTVKQWLKEEFWQTLRLLGLEVQIILIAVSRQLISNFLCWDTILNLSDWTKLDFWDSPCTNYVQGGALWSKSF